MFLLRILLKIILAPVSLMLLVAKGVIHLAINLASAVIGLFLLYVGFALVYCLIVSHDFISLRRAHIENTHDFLLLRFGHFISPFLLLIIAGSNRFVNRFLKKFLVYITRRPGASPH